MGFELGTLGGISSLAIGGNSPSPEFSVWAMIDVVSADKITPYLELKHNLQSNKFTFK